MLERKIIPVVKDPYIFYYSEKDIYESIKVKIIKRRPQFTDLYYYYLVFPNKMEADMTNEKDLYKWALDHKEA